MTHCVAKADLRGSHEGGERLADSVDRLMRTIVRVRVEQDGRPAVMKVALLSRTTEHDDAKGLLYYRLDAELRRIIQDSRVFGRLRNEVMFAFTSKYALALYETGEKRRNMQFRWSEIFEIGELRAAFAEVQRHSAGRRARLSGTVEAVVLARLSGA